MSKLPVVFYAKYDTLTLNRQRMRLLLKTAYISLQKPISGK